LSRDVDPTYAVDGYGRERKDVGETVRGKWGSPVDCLCKQS
jgi:hypothetical protein